MARRSGGRSAATGVLATLLAAGISSAALLGAPAVGATAEPTALDLTTVATVADLNHNRVPDLHDTIQWSFVVVNAGTGTLNGLAISDATAGRVMCREHVLVVGASTTCAAAIPYVIEQSDVDAGHVDNTATASGHWAGTTTTVESDPSSTSTVIGSLPALQLVKAGTVQDNGDGRIDTGDRIRWTFTVTNTGNVTLHALAVQDPTGGSVSCAVTYLQPTGSTTCVGDRLHVVTTDDLSAGSVTNTATASGMSRGAVITTSPPSTAVVALTNTAGLRVAPVAAVSDANGDHVTDAGDVLSWHFVVTNIGDVALHGLDVSDLHGDAISCRHSLLAPLARLTCVSAARTITPALAATGHITSVASAAGTTPAGRRVTSPPAVAIVVIHRTRAPGVTTTVSGSAGTAGAGDVALTGAGDVPLLVSISAGLLLVGGLLTAGGAARRRR